MLSGIYSVPFWHCILPFYLEFVLAFFFPALFCHFFVRFICLSILIISNYFWLLFLFYSNIHADKGTAEPQPRAPDLNGQCPCLALAMGVRQRLLRSRTRRCGPAVPTEICSSLLLSGSAQCDLEFAVEVRQCPLRWGVRNWQLRHWDLELPVESPLRSWVRGWNPAVLSQTLRSWLRSGSAHWKREAMRRKEEEGGGRRKEEEGGGRRRKEEEGGGRRREEEGGGRRKEKEGRRQETLIKSKDPQLAGGENHDKITASPLQKPAMEQTHDIWLQAHRTENKKSMRKND